MYVAMCVQLYLSFFPDGVLLTRAACRGSEADGSFAHVLTMRVFPQIARWCCLRAATWGT